MAEYELHHANLVADARLTDAGYTDLGLEALNLPEVQYAEAAGHRAVAYVVHGQPDAPNVLLHPTPMFTDIAPHFNLRLAAQQAVLGDEYAVIGVEGYSPKTGGISHEDRRQLASGSFAPLAARVLLAAEAAGVHDGQRVYPYGFSLGGDVAIQTAHDVIHDPNRGAFNIQGLGAAEPARMVDRGLAVVKAFTASGGDMYKNIVASGMPALEEAWNIRQPGPAAERKLNMAAGLGIARYVGSNLLNNIAIARGFGSDMSARQLDDLLAGTELPIMLAREERSTVTPKQSVDTLQADHPGRPGFNVVVGKGDHSSDDMVPLSAGRALYFASLMK